MGVATLRRHHLDVFRGKCVWLGYQWSGLQLGPNLFFSKEELLLCALRRGRSAVDVAAMDFCKRKHVATLRTPPGHETFQKVTPKVVPKLPQRVQIGPKMTPREIPKLPRIPPASFRGRRKAPQSPHGRKPDACQPK